jgi:predicted nucleic acid-binding protein
VARLILDSGAVLALAAGQPRARQVVERALRERTLLVIPAVVIAETTRGGARDARVNRVLKAVQDIAPVTESVAREAGRLLAAAKVGNATVDALIVAEAVLHGPALILTGDLADIGALAVNLPRVRVSAI